MKKTCFATFLSTTMLFGWHSPSFAQGEAAMTSSTAEEDNAIVVTAQKRAENVQNVPISIAAVSGEKLEAANITSVMDLGNIATNFQTVHSSSTAATRVSIRGVGALANSLMEPSVAVFADGIYIPRSGSILGTFLDVEGVEVLRGPQGTLFGRNASVGALSIRSTMPRDELSGEVAAEAGSFDRYKLSGSMNIPITQNMSARFAAMTQTYDGPWKNRFDGKTYGGSDQMAYRATLKADIGAVEWILRGDFSRLKGDGVSNFDLDAASVSLAQLALIQTKFNGGPDTNLADRIMNQSVATGLIDKNWGISSSASLEFGGSTLRLINSYRQWTNDQLDGDVTYFPADLVTRRNMFNSKSQNHELQFISPNREWLDGNFDMVAGLYYFEEDFNLGERLNIGSQFCDTYVPSGGIRAACAAYYNSTGGVAATDQNVFQHARSIAAYAQGNIYLSDALTLTLGGRWTNDHKRGRYSQLSSPFTQTMRAPEALDFPAISDSRFTYRVNLSYEPTDDIMLFANHSTGYKSGGYNSGGGAPSLSTLDIDGNLLTKRLFDRETVKDYELGIKSSWLDRALTANLTFYRMDITGFQDRAFDGVSFVVRNAGNLRQQGFEFELVMAPSRNFSFSSSIAYLDSKFTRFTNASNLPGLGGTQDLTGKPNSWSPPWSGNVAVDWKGDVGSTGLTWSANANLSFVSDQFVGLVNDANPQSIADGYGLLGARLTLNGENDRWSVAIFGSNLTNTHYRSLTTYEPFGAALGLNNGAFLGSAANRIMASEPRTYGVSASLRF